MGPHLLLEKTLIKRKNRVQNCLNYAFMEEFAVPNASSVTHRLVYIHLLAHNGGKKVGLALPVAVHNMPRVILTHISQP